MLLLKQKRAVAPHRGRAQLERKKNEQPPPSPPLGSVPSLWRGSGAAAKARAGRGWYAAGPQPGSSTPFPGDCDDAGHASPRAVGSDQSPHWSPAGEASRVASTLDSFSRVEPSSLEQTAPSFPLRSGSSQSFCGSEPTTAPAATTAPVGAPSQGSGPAVTLSERIIPPGKGSVRPAGGGESCFRAERADSTSGPNDRSTNSTDSSSRSCMCGTSSSTRTTRKAGGDPPRSLR